MGRPRQFAQPMMQIRSSLPATDYGEVEIAAMEANISVAQWIRDLVEFALDTGWNAPPDGNHAYTIDGRRA